MSRLTAKLFRDYFGGNWSGKVIRNGEFQREIIFNWPQTFGRYSALGTEAGMVVPRSQGVLDDTRQISIAGWRNDLHRWCYSWFNEFGGCGELQWTSQEEINGVTILYGFVHECKQETDDPTEHIIQCELINQNKFKYTIRSFRKGIQEIVATRISSAKKLRTLMEQQSLKITSFEELNRM